MCDVSVLYFVMCGMLHVLCADVCMCYVLFDATQLIAALRASLASLCRMDFPDNDCAYMHALEVQMLTHTFFFFFWIPSH